MKIIDDIKAYPKDVKLAVLIRHADRDKIPDGSFGNEVLLNRKGVENSIAFGEKLKDVKINRIFTSPILRCIQTAEFIEEGHGSDLTYHITKSLGDPGLHIADDKMAGEFILKHGFDVMYRKFVNGEEIPGVSSLQEFEKQMTSFIERNTTDSGVTFFVTHDSVIAFYDFCLSKKEYIRDNWVDYLSGMVLKIE
jgi:broad specificity phosphatase PhoE